MTTEQLLVFGGLAPVLFLFVQGRWRYDIVTLHCPLTPDTHHLIDAEALRRMKPGVMLINTSRGALLDTRAVIDALKSGAIGYLRAPKPWRWPPGRCLLKKIGTSQE